MGTHDERLIAIYRVLDREAARCASRAPFLGNEAEEALSSATFFFVNNPTSPEAPAGVFQTCLRRHLAERLKMPRRAED